MVVAAADRIVAGRQQIGAEVIRGGEKIGKFHMLIAGDTGDGGFARDIGARERLNHFLAKALLVVEHIVGNTEPSRDVPRVVDILPRATRAFAMVASPWS